MVAWQLEGIDYPEVLPILAGGLRVDVMLLSMALILPVLLVSVLPGTILISRIYRRGVIAWLGGWTLTFAFLEVVTPAYMSFFNVRPGRIFFEYLNRPLEVAGLVSSGYPMSSLLAIVVPFALLYFILPRFSTSQRITLKPTDRLLLIPVILLLALGARSSVGHRPANPSTFAFSSNPTVNSLTLNSTYQLLYAIYSLRHESDPGRFYPAMETGRIFANVAADSGISPRSLIEADSMQHRFGTGAQPAAPKHILIIVEESLGARFVGALGGLPLTPNLDALSDEGIWFERLYATGIRSARGLEAIAAGFPPSPARSVLKLGGTQTGFYTLARSLGPLGYTSYFVYGGAANFDNMQGFFLNNGFDVAIDVDDYDEWTFKGTWGVSDEDLFEKTHALLSSADTPVFALAFTSSFHTPFEFPEGRIELYDQPKASKHNAVKYADFALGSFIRKAQQSDYWDNTIVLVVADHDERPHGRDLVPISSYHIPGVILGADVAPRKISRITSQIDLLPTLLDLAGISGTAPVPGESALSADPQQPGRAVMQYGDNHAYLRGDQVVIHRPNLPAAQFVYDPDADTLTLAPLDQSLSERARAWALLPGLLYREGRYSASPEGAR